MIKTFANRHSQELYTTGKSKRASSRYRQASNT